MDIQTKLYAVEAFEHFLALPENRERLFELIHGEIVEKIPTEEHGIIVFIISGELYIYLRHNPGGRAGIEVRHQTPGDEHNSRLPDISYIRDTSAPVTKQGSIPRMPDLAVEVKSPDDTYK